MSPKQRAEQQSSGAAEHDVDASGARGCRGRDGRLTGGNGPVDEAGYEARLVTLNSRSSVAGRLNGRRPELRRHDSRGTTSAGVWQSRKAHRDGVVVQNWPSSSVSCQLQF